MFVLFFGPVVHSWAFLLSFFNFVSNFLCHPFLLTLSFLSITLPCRSHSAFVVVVVVILFFLLLLLHRLPLRFLLLRFSLNYSPLPSVALSVVCPQ